MQTTYSALILHENSSSAFNTLDEMGVYYGKVKRQLYKTVARHGKKCKDYKVEFCAKYKLTSRQFNAIAVDLQGAIDATKELLKLEAKKLSKAIKSKKGMLKRSQTLIKDINEGKKKLRKKALKALKRRLHQLPKDIPRCQAKLKKINHRLKSNVPGICFGTRKLFNARFHLNTSGFSSKEEWLAHWRAARAHQFFFLGSKDETAGNQSCVLTVTEQHGPPTLKTLLGITPDPLKLFNARIRLPTELIKEGAQKYMTVQFKLSYGQREVLYALEHGIALSYRFHRENDSKLKAGEHVSGRDKAKDKAKSKVKEDSLKTKDGAEGEDSVEEGVVTMNSSGATEYNPCDRWYVHISTDVPDAALKTASKSYGVLGVDFNADHLAVTSTNYHGNLLKKNSFILDLPVAGKSSNQRTDILSLALDKVVDYALKHKLPIAIEELDFSAKKSNMARRSKRHRVMLSSLMYSKYQWLLRAKCSRAGVELIQVNPAYTSVIGRIKYALPYGQSVHLSASGVIARRAQGYCEKVPEVARVATGPVVSEFALPVRNRAFNKSSRWHWYSLTLRKTLFKVISAQKRRDKHRFRYRQHSLA